MDKPPHGAVCSSGDLFNTRSFRAVRATARSGMDLARSNILRSGPAVSIREVVIILRPIQILPLAVLMVAVSSCGVMDGDSGFPPPPRNPPVGAPVTISPDGRVITVRAAKPCGHRPLLIARPYPHLVTLRLVNRDVGNCHVEAVPVISVSVTLPSPLGTRSLVQATTGKPIRYQVVSPSPRPARSSPPSGTLRATPGSRRA